MLCLIIEDCNCARNVAFESRGEFGCGVCKIKSNLSSNPRRKNFQSNEKIPISDKVSTPARPSYSEKEVP